MQYNIIIPIRHAQDEKSHDVLDSAHQRQIAKLNMGDAYHFVKLPARTFVSGTELSNSNFRPRGVGAISNPTDLPFTHNRHKASHVKYQMM